MYGYMIKCGCGGLAEFTVWRTMVCYVILSKPFLRVSLNYCHITPHQICTLAYQKLEPAFRPNVSVRCWKKRVNISFTFIPVPWCHYLKCIHALFDVNIFRSLFSFMAVVCVCMEDFLCSQLESASSLCVFWKQQLSEILKYCHAHGIHEAPLLSISFKFVNKIIA